MGFVVSIAGTTADTWASEIGSLNKKPPRNVLTGKQMISGMSGGVSLLGFFASLLGSSLIIGFFGAVNQLTPLVLLPTKSTLLLLLLGFLNSLIDSVLGATFQGAYRCQVCLCPTEKRSHHQLPTIKTHGITWVTNDFVNVISTSLTTSLTWFIFI